MKTKVVRELEEERICAAQFDDYMTAVSHIDKNEENKD
jgi:hypothetical protein